jgi:hypothetical protein
MDRFVPEQERKGGAIAIRQFPSPLVAATSARRVLAVLDSIGGKVSWWQLPEEVWAAVGSTRKIPHIDVRLLGTDSDSLAPPISNWTETISEDRPGAPVMKLLDGNSGVGGDRLLIYQGSSKFISWASALQISDTGKGWPTSVYLVDQYPADNAILLIPGCSAYVDSPHWALSICPSAVFPFRFSVPKVMIPASGKMNVEATIRLSAGED